MTYILIFFTVTLVMFLGLRYWIFNTAPYLPAETDTLIQEIMSSDLPELMPGKSGFAQNGNLKICYEVLGDKDASQETVLLINGHTQSLIDYTPDFWQPLVDAGYRVVRYDNRGFGCSDWVKDWSRSNKYRLKDMATDGIAVLDHLNIKKAHVIGVSMGGMIGQRIAISHGERLLSLTSIMSTGFYFDPELTDTPKPFIRELVKLTLRYKRTIHQNESKLKFYLGIREMLRGKGGNYKLDTKEILQQGFYEITKRKGLNAKATDQHSIAIKASGSRYDELGKINVPTLVIHGTDDTLILVSHAKKYAPMIPNSTSLILEGMGHDLPKKYIPEIMESIFQLFEKTKTRTTTL